ncbi:hypothetical protein F511_27405 [Dorcoceras hygrometricum]|uniref:Uncharacterized protein n=1 Tax=Dorcoceras hygrometricum TaxID=472368 RepID=A0A2Z7C0N7_9LAMI|nr:hypothetical protein F511_27405 [Dorcoceras hygrometricum]
MVDESRTEICDLLGSYHVSRKDPLEDLILHLVYIPDPSALMLRELQATNAHQLVDFDLNNSLNLMSCAPSHTWAHEPTCTPAVT